MTKSMGPPTLEALAEPCEKPATGKEQERYHNVSQVTHGKFTSTPRNFRGTHGSGKSGKEFGGSAGNCNRSPWE